MAPAWSRHPLCHPQPGLRSWAHRRQVPTTRTTNPTQPRLPTVGPSPTKCPPCCLRPCPEAVQPRGTSRTPPPWDWCVPRWVLALARPRMVQCTQSWVRCWCFARGSHALCVLLRVVHTPAQDVLLLLPILFLPHTHMIVLFYNCMCVCVCVRVCVRVRVRFRAPVLSVLQFNGRRVDLMPPPMPLSVPAPLPPAGYTASTDAAMSRYYSEKLKGWDARNNATSAVLKSHAR